MTPRSRTTWAIFAACLALVALALFWVTREVLDLEEREVAARNEARLHESMRLALWRMDSALTPILAQEAARAPGAGWWPPLPPHFEAFRSYFAIGGNGVPSDPAVAPFVPALRPPAPKTETALGERREQAQRDLAAAPDPQAGQFHAGANPQVEQSKDEYQSRLKMAQQAQQTLMAENFSENDRKRALDNELKKNKAQVPIPPVGKTDSRPAGLPVDAVSYLHLDLADLEAGPLEPRWAAAGGRPRELFLVRKVRDRNTGGESLQGIWCDWPKLERWLLGSARDLFPESRLLPAAQPSEEDQATLLATIPARLVPGNIGPAAAATAPAPARLVLVVAWLAALGAVGAVGGVLRAAMSLGDRRGRFVSAVTHELRTPLTTFRMYSQMLADGMVPDASRAEYLATLKQEAERLSRVVESVLLYSRLEEGRGGAHRELVSCAELIDRLLPTLRKRAADGGMALDASAEIDPARKLVVDVQAVEQILLNLVDNACKYAQATDQRLELFCRTTARALEVACRDFGPGIPPEEREAVFQPFRRGARHAAGTTPGVGLGLALARGLAQALGGDLVLAPETPGACFIVRIPLTSG